MTELSGTEHGADIGLASSSPVPRRPVPREAEWGDWPFLLSSKLSYSRRASIGWQYRPDKRGGPCFLVGRETLGGSIKVLQRFPFTDEGWAQAWRFLLQTDDTLAESLRAELGARDNADLAAAEIKRLDASALEAVENVIFLGGHAAAPGLVSGGRYDLRFRSEDLLITRSGQAEPLLDALFGDLQAIEIGGPGTVRQYSVGQQIGLEMFLGGLGDVIGRAAT